MIEALWDYQVEIGDMNTWSNDFVSSMQEKLEAANGSTTSFSEKQVDKIDQLYRRYVLGHGE